MAKRYQGDNQNLYIIDEQTTQWPKDTKDNLTDSDYTLGIFWPLCCLFLYDIQILITPLVSFGHCVVYSSMIYRFWLSLVSYRGTDNTMAKIYQGCNQNL
jgi:hypothetical protein